MISWLRRILPGQDARDQTGSARRPDPSEPFIVNLYDDRVVVHRPDGQREELAWNVLERVVVRVSDRAPWAGRAWLILIGAPDSGQGCVVPFDAANHAALLEQLRALPGFNQQKLDNALRDAAAGKSRSDAICWKRGAEAQPGTGADQAGDSDNGGPAA
ncbi:conserved hypothetical protein [Cupriavidus taiwanensis]|uniref:Uncharacterized protein n=1 Tax=Cupriavidus taiwanensis TaxID=164546 RepID=A0A976G304_9BURK|nr:hypothetical protein [Cupriavidus taiwanensis]SOZ15190.1 conserved hypothetical protein [Cupriavidus taiwanensis]SOZ27434.1 conserved hypothetical protein [Cupriavidus taiwanensis]SOZ45762.1 conserved hypothetical protein [Cupriavidus taiwanensis]SOZ60508.1 conserved hypothetical protein [Cupriavidus taiwanensis]SOZ60567.1 conserved hypothetical protein [Cupriavidus taiwanensis]